MGVPKSPADSRPELIDLYAHSTQRAIPRPSADLHSETRRRRDRHPTHVGVFHLPTFPTPALPARHRIASMAFHYQPAADLSSDDEGGAPLDLNAWKSGAAQPAPQPPSQSLPAQAPAPTAPVVADNEEDSNDELAADPLSAFKTGKSTSQRSASRASPSTSTPAASVPVLGRTGSGFTSINRGPSMPQYAAAAENEVPEFDANNIPVGDGEDDQEDEPDEEAEGVQEVRSKKPARSEEAASRREASTTSGRRSTTREPGEDEDEEPEGLVPVLPRHEEVDENEVVDMTAGEDTVRRVLAEIESVGGTIAYKVEMGDYSVELVSSNLLPFHAFRLFSPFVYFACARSTMFFGCLLPTRCAVVQQLLASKSGDGSSGWRRFATQLAFTFPAAFV